MMARSPATLRRIAGNTPWTGIQTGRFIQGLIAFLLLVPG
jgi:hypothetical protein